MDLYDPYMVPYTIPQGYYIFQGVQTKFHFLTKFPHLDEFVNLMKDLKYEHQSTNMNTKFWGGGGGWVIIIFQGVLTKLNVLMKFQHLKKNYIFFAFFCCGGGSNLILGTDMENQIFILRTPAAIKFFHQILKNCHFGVKKNHYPRRWICMTHIKAPTLFP